MINYFMAINIIFNSLGKHIYDLKYDYIYLYNAINTIAYNNVKSIIDVPTFTNSAMDGYAVNYKKWNILYKNKMVVFYIINRVKAGFFLEYKTIDNNFAIEIMTGARLPNSYDSIIKIEDVYLKNKYNFSIKNAIQQYQHVRFVGEDFKKHDVILKKGDLLNCNYIMALSAIGLNKITVLKFIKCFLLSTGNEIIDYKKNKKFLNSCIYNASFPYILSVFKSKNINIKYLGLVSDDINDFIKKINYILSINYISVLITTGAVSKGKADFIPKILKYLGVKILFHSVNIKPGKPILFAKFKKHIYFFCLPGNPISSIIGLRFFLYPFINFFLNQNLEQPIKAKSINDFKKKIKKDFFLKAYTYFNKANIYVKILDDQESFKIKIMLYSNSFVFLFKNSIIKKGDMLNVYFTNI